MYRGTDATLTFTLPFDCSKVSALFITFAQKLNPRATDSTVMFEKTLTGCRLEGTKVYCMLTEEDTLKLDDKCCVEIQMRGICDGKKFASNICQKNVGRILKKGPLPNEVTP